MVSSCGRPRWATTLHGWGSATSPVLYKDLVIINASVESESLYGLDRKSGREVWRARGIRESWNTPILVETASGETELVVAIMGKILGFNPATGKELWSCETNINWYMAPSMVAHNDVVYSVGGRTGGALAVRVGGRGDVTATHRLWTGRKGSNVTSPVYHQDHLYWMHENLGIAVLCEGLVGRDCLRIARSRRRTGVCIADSRRRQALLPGARRQDTCPSGRTKV